MKQILHRSWPDSIRRGSAYGGGQSPERMWGQYVYFLVSCLHSYYFFLGFLLTLIYLFRCSCSSLKIFFFRQQFIKISKIEKIHIFLPFLPFFPNLEYPTSLASPQAQGSHRLCPRPKKGGGDTYREDRRKECGFFGLI